MTDPRVQPIYMDLGSGLPGPPGPGGTDPNAVHLTGAQTKAGLLTLIDGVLGPLFDKAGAKVSKTTITVGGDGADFDVNDYTATATRTTFDLAIEAAINSVAAGFSAGGEILVRNGQWDKAIAGSLGGTDIALSVTNASTAASYSGSTNPTVGQPVVGDSITTGTVVLSVNSGAKTVVLSAAAIATTTSQAGAATGNRHNIRLRGEGMGTQIRWSTAIPPKAGEFLFILPSYGGVSMMQLIGQSNYTCPINGVATFTAGGANTHGGGLYLAGARLFIELLLITGMAGDGIYVNGISAANAAHANKYANFFIVGCGGVGLNMQGFSYDSELINVWIGSCTNAANVTNGACTFSGCHFWGTTGDAVDVSGARCRFHGCYWDSAGVIGLKISNTYGCIVMGCDIYNSGCNGAQSIGLYLLNATKCNVIGNVFVNNNGIAVSVDGTSFYNNVCFNQFIDFLATFQSTLAFVNKANGVATASSTAFTDTVDAPFVPPATSPAQSSLGRSIVITGAGAAGAVLTTTVAAVASTSSITLTDAASTSVNPATFRLANMTYGIRESGTAANNQFFGNNINKNEQLLGHVVTLNPSTGAGTATGGNVGINANNIFKQTINSGSSSIDLRNGGVQYITLTASTTLSFFPSSGQPVGSEWVLYFIQDATGSRTVTWPAVVGGTGPTLSTGANKVDVLVLQWDGTKWRQKNFRADV